MTDERSRNELSGTVFGPSVQAGAIHGDVHFHDGSPAPAIPRQLLASPPHFTNRATELAKLDALRMASGNRLVILSGPGGVGKTALATRWAHAAKNEFEDGQLFIDLNGFGDEPPVQPGEALGRFLRALGLAPRHVPLSPTERAALFRSMTAKRTLLILLDNAFSAAQARSLLPGSDRSMVVVTSRSRLSGLLADGGVLLEVGPLGLDDSINLLGKVLGTERVAREGLPARHLAQFCAGLPIAICVAAARLASRPHLSLARMSTELNDAPLDRLASPDGPSVQAAFDASYRSLDPQAAVLYRRLSLHPGPEFGLGPVTVVTPEATAIDRLLEANLLQEIGDDRFTFHDLLRVHARHKAHTDDTPADRDAVRRDLLEWYLASAVRADTVLTPYRHRLVYRFAREPVCLPVTADRDAALDWLERERVNLLAAGDAALAEGRAELAWHLCDAFWGLHVIRKHYPDQRVVDERGVQAARRWGARWAEAVMCNRLGRILSTFGDFAAAEHHLSLAVRLYQEVDDVRGALDAQAGLALLYRASEREPAAVELLRRVLATNRELDHRREIGLTLISLARSLTDLGQPREAVTLLHEAHDVFAGLAVPDRYNEARATIALAAAQLASNDATNAECMALDAARRMRDLGSEYERTEALELLGRIAERRGELDAARDHYRTARQILETLGSPRSADVARRLNRLS